MISHIALDHQVFVLLTYTLWSNAHEHLYWIPMVRCISSVFMGFDATASTVMLPDVNGLKLASNSDD